MTDQTSSDQRTALLVVFGCMFSTIGMAIGSTDSYGVLSFLLLGLGVLTLLAAVLLPSEEGGASDKEGQGR